MEQSAEGSRFAISNELWSLIEPHIPKRKNKHRFGGGRPRKPDRACMDAIFFVLRSSSTAHDRFQEWEKAGVFLKLWKAGLLKYDQAVGIDWDWLSMDGAMTKSPLSGEKMRT